MWNKPWTFKEGFIIGGGLLLTGLMLQMAVGPVIWDLFAWPVNIIFVVIYLAALLGLYAFRKKLYAVQWLMSYTAAIPALAWCAGMTLIMGLTPQLTGTEGGGIFGISHMLSFWSFVLLYWWMATIVGLITLRRILHFRLANIPFILNHLGLFIALVAATLGNADMQRLKMTVKMGTPEWRGVDDSEQIHELDLAIDLHSFTIDEYPPKLMLVDNETGKLLPTGNPENILVEDSVMQGKLMDWDIEITQHIENAAMVSDEDSVNYVLWPSMGATCAVHAYATNSKTGVKRSGWVTCGSFMFPYKALKLDDKCSLIMPDREPRRYASDVSVYTEQGDKYEGTIEVNNAMEVNGWKIYQLSYDEALGKWSDTSVFELVKDPWLPVVYVGIIMMLSGAVCMFATASRRKEEEV